jgi:hypothetical protein
MTSLYPAHCLISYGWPPAAPAGLCDARLASVRGLGQLSDAVLDAPGEHADVRVGGIVGGYPKGPSRVA